MKKSTAITTTASEESLAIIEQEYPREQSSFSKILLPRIIFFAKDKMEGKGKNMRVVSEAGTFFSEAPNEDGEWEKTELGKSIDVNMIYHRRQLRYWDQANESYINSPIYDTNDDIIPLFQEKKEIDRGTQLQLQEKYPPKEGRKMSALEDERVLYVLYAGKTYQMSIKGSSKWAFLAYSRATNPATVLTTIASEEKKNGQNQWNTMTFTAKRAITEEEAKEIIAKVGKIKTSIADEKLYYQNYQKMLSKYEVEKEFETF